MNSKKIAVVVNPASANGATAKRWPEIQALMEKEGLFPAVFFTSGPGEATRLTRKALEEGYDLIVSAGGDGTANEVVNGFFGPQGIVREGAVAGFISMGTGGDLIKTLGIPKDPAEAVRHLIKSSCRPLDLGRVSYVRNDGVLDTRFFINVAGLGLDGDTVARVNRTSKVLGGFVSFLWGTVVSLLLYQNQPMTISVDGKLICDAPVTFVVVGNGRYFGGGMFIAPPAEMDDGWFEVIILNNLSKAALLANLPKVYRGTHLGHPKITSLRGRKVEIESLGSALLNLDGEQPGRAPVKIELLPRALQVQG
ncbi:MAG: diacylglycerol kinase family lipid kinase [Dethiobacter sp.]|nr:diacylglycerol kinase family lipid kinase [Dethiobacter sp.]